VPSALEKQEMLAKSLQFFGIALACFAIHLVLFIKHYPVYFIPDLVLVVYLIYKFRDLNQSVSPLFFVGLALLLGYYFLSPNPPDTSFPNNYIVTLKPFVYICILALYSQNVPQVNLIKWIRIFLIVYPLVLGWNLFLVHLSENANIGQLMMTRPFFIFENNFEITFYLNCFIIVFFIYGERRLLDFVLLVITIILAGSRSGLLSFAVVCCFYFFSVGWRYKIMVSVLAVAAAAYIGKGRNISAPLGTIDRVQSFQAIFHHYGDSFMEVLKEPFGFGVYQKVPGYICTRLPDFAEWFTGNSHNCDPLMLQAFYSRSLYQLGIYVTLLIPILFFLLVKRETGWKIAILILTPITCVATSVGGFSNGLAFWGVLLSVYAYQQFKNPSLILSPTAI
jgi:hypothetical protein